MLTPADNMLSGVHSHAATWPSALAAGNMFFGQHSPTATERDPHAVRNTSWYCVLWSAFPNSN